MNIMQIIIALQKKKSFCKALSMLELIEKNKFKTSILNFNRIK